MFETKKTLIVVYEDELLMNQLKKMVETCNDNEQGVVGAMDNSINIVSWTEDVWLAQKKTGNIHDKILFLGEIKDTDKLIPVIDVVFNEFGVKFGWAGNQAILYADLQELTSRKDYDAFLENLSVMPVPHDIIANKNDKKNKNKILKKTWVVIAFRKVKTKFEELFRDKAMMKRQMLFYGVVKLYNYGLEKFMNM